MNGKQAKMLRRMGKGDNISKRLFNKMSAATKGKLRAVSHNFEPTPAVDVVPLGLEPEDATKD